MPRRQPYSYFADPAEAYREDETQQPNYGVPQYGQMSPFQDAPAPPAPAQQQPRPQPGLQPQFAPPPPQAGPMPQGGLQRGQDPTQFMPPGGAMPGMGGPPGGPMGPSGPISQGGLHSDASQASQLRLDPQQLAQFASQFPPPGQAPGQAMPGGPMPGPQGPHAGAQAAPPPNQPGPWASGYVPNHANPADAEAAVAGWQPGQQAPPDLSQFTQGGHQYGQADPSTGRIGTAAQGLRHSSHGFDFEQDPETRDIGRHAKYAFAHLADQAPSAPKNHEEAAQWFDQHIRPGMEALGHKIDWVQGDKFQFTNWQGTFVVDFVSDSGGANPQLWWGADAPGGSPGGAPQGQFNPRHMSAAAQGVGDDDLALAQQLGIDTNNPLWRQMFEEFYGGGLGGDYEDQTRRNTGITYQP